MLPLLLACVHGVPPSDQRPDVDALLKAGEIDGAIGACTEILARSPGDPGVLFLRFELQVMEEAWDAAESDLVLLAAGQPEMGDVWAALGGLVRAERERAAAVAADAAPLGPLVARSGTVDGVPFTAIGDADDVLAPVLECLTPEGYARVAFADVARIELAAPANYLDVLWRPATIALASGESGTCFVPTLYAGTAAMGREAQMGWFTGFTPRGGEALRGWGQRDLEMQAEAGGTTLIGIRQVSVIAFD